MIFLFEGQAVNGEIWRDVPRVPGILARSEGRIMHAPHRGPMPKGGERLYGGMPTFGILNKQTGRRKLINRHRRLQYEVSRLVAEAFHGPPPFPGAVAMRIDENATNNRVKSTLGDAEGKPEPGIYQIPPGEDRGKQSGQ